MVVISSRVAESALCWCEGRKIRGIPIFRRVTHPVGGLESYPTRRIANDKCGLPLWPSVSSVVQGLDLHHGGHRGHGGKHYLALTRTLLNSIIASWPNPL